MLVLHVFYLFQFPVHKLLLSHSLPGISLSSLSGLDDESTEVLLRYAYGRCLPEAAEEDEEMTAGEGGEKRWTEVLDAANKAAEGLDLPQEAGSGESGDTLGGFSYCRQTFSQKSKICNSKYKNLQQYCRVYLQETGATASSSNRGRTPAATRP